MNLLIDPGIESQSAAWQVTDSQLLASFSQQQAHAGTWSLKLPRVLVDLSGDGSGPFVWFSGQFTQGAIPLTPGEPMNISAWVFSSVTSSSVGLNIQCDKGSGTFSASSNFNSLPIGWSLVTMPTFTATGTVGRIRLTVNGPLSGAALVYVDDVSWDWPTPPEVDEVATRHRHEVIAALVTVLKTIAPPTYWTDIGSRVYTRFPAPDEIGKGSLPALFVVEASSDVSDIQNTDHGIERIITPRIIGIVRETSTDPRVATATEAINKLSDDVIGCLLRNLGLNGKTGGPLMFVQDALDSGISPDFGAFEIVVSVPLYVFSANLGPLAV